jgi:hypothetical protein
MLGHWWPLLNTKCAVVGYLTTSDHQLYRVWVLETPFWLLIRFYYNLNHMYYNQLLHSYMFTQFTGTALYMQQFSRIYNTGVIQASLNYALQILAAL